MDPDAAYAARLMQETDEGLATEVMEWEIRPRVYYFGGSAIKEPWLFERVANDTSDPGDEWSEVRRLSDWFPSRSWIDWGLVFARVSTPTPDGQLVRQLWVTGPTSEGSWTSTATASGGEVYNGFGPTPLAAMSDATLKAVRGRKAVLEKQAGWAWRQAERIATLDERKKERRGT